MNKQSTSAMANIRRIYEREGGKMMFKNLLDNQKKEISGMFQNFSKELDTNLDKKIKHHLQDFSNELDGKIEKKIKEALQTFSVELDGKIEKKIKEALQTFSVELDGKIEKKIKEALQTFSIELDGKLDNIINDLQLQDKRIKALEHNYNALTSIKLKYYSEMIETLKDKKSNDMDKLPGNMNNRNDDDDDDVGDRDV